MEEKISDLKVQDIHTGTHLQAVLVPTLLTLSASFPERHIKGHVHRGALCSLKCSRAATDPQILTFKPSAGNREHQKKRETETGREGGREHMHRQTDRQTDGGKCLLL